jgi:hypothetical protein
MIDRNVPLPSCLPPGRKGHNINDIPCREAPPCLPRPNGVGTAGLHLAIQSISFLESDRILIDHMVRKIRFFRFPQALLAQILFSIDIGIL